MLCLLDLSAEFWRHSYGGKEPTLGYDVTMERLIRERVQCDRFLVCLDSPRLERKLLSADYKSKRPPKPEEALDALSGIEARIVDMRIPHCRVDGWEADDVIATLCAQSWPEPTTVIGAEKDMLQLLPLGHISLYGGNGVLMDRQYCLDKFGVEPELMQEWQALAGDSTDGVPGCPNVGAGRATVLLRRFGSLQNILAAPDEEILSLKGIGQKSLDGLRSWDHALSLSLVTLRRDLPVSLVKLLGDDAVSNGAIDSDDPRHPNHPLGCVRPCCANNAVP